MTSRAPRRPAPAAGPRVRARKRHGQHFLEAAWADKVVEAIRPHATDRFLEIGPGPGALTLRLAPRVASLTAVEVDARLVALLEPQLPANVRLIHADLLETAIDTIADGPLRVAGNLPYNVSSPILFRLLSAWQHGTRLVDATLMLQREVAERMAAPPGGRDYGVLSIFVQLDADVRRVLSLPPGAFRPAPKVHSSLVTLTFRRPAVEVGDRVRFERMVRSMFTRRRKTLANALAPFAASVGLSAGALLERAGIAPTRRPETLQLAELARLAAGIPSD